VTVYDDVGAKIEERDYLWLDTLPIAQSQRSFSGSTVTSSQFVYLHADQLETPRLATNGSGTVVWRWDSDAFGVGAANLDPDADTNEVNVRLRFPGQYLDEETGLHYNYFRDYDPVTGRYMESDPIGLGGGLNTYLFTEGNPLRYSDPLGLWSVTVAVYRGRGGALTFGYDAGKPFVVADAGFGLGAGISFNPTGGFPRPADSCGVPESEEAFIGFQGTLGLNFGPLGIGGTGYTGWNVSRDSDGRPNPRFVDGRTSFGRLRHSDGSWGIGLQLSGGARVGLAGPK
jgi:RHS repeat-associated protein